ncbi:hypothetical protein [Glaciecola petra]|uniref:Uncharacterized protein n=1 Tax=Glaciecola petra TaxID=3075602 RepID=A0ABU2ZVP9_9ALTE|nr:hypothetical protein [Aestuariibacter sp. P117]MDT0596108.1 hypothetical protein [Aestuariibacter sp. P117]
MKRYDPTTFIFILFDPPIRWLVAVCVNQQLVTTSIRIERTFFEKQDGSNKVNYINTMLGAIHARAAAAIGHVSIMMSMTIILALNVDLNVFFKIAVIIEIFLYMVLLLLCLRCVRSLTLNDGKLHFNLDDIYNRELIYRFSIQQLVNAGLVLATVGFFFLVLSYLITDILFRNEQYLLTY